MEGNEPYRPDRGSLSHGAKGLAQRWGGPVGACWRDHGVVVAGMGSRAGLVAVGGGSVVVAGRSGPVVAATGRTARFTSPADASTPVAGAATALRKGRPDRDPESTQEEHCPPCSVPRPGFRPRTSCLPAGYRDRR